MLTESMAQNETTLTAKQAEVLQYIESEVARSGRPPTYRDIAKHLGYDAVGTVQDHIRALIRKGFLKKDAGVARGIQLAHHTGAVEVPILGSVPAGKPIEAIQESLGSIPAPAKWGGADRLFALKVTGESMIEAGIMDGDFVVVRKQDNADHGDIVVALIDGEATVKYLEKKAGRIRLIPANPNFTPIDLGRGASEAIQGKVIGVQRFY